jgi:hypothetical protein
MAASEECVLGDWVFDPFATPLAVYPARGVRLLPIGWTGDVPAQVHWADGLAETMPGVALVYHWSQAHPDLLESLIGEFETDTYPRSR